MKRFLLGFAFLLSGLLGQTSPAMASGSNTVLISVRPTDYDMMAAQKDKHFSKSQLYSYLESEQQDQEILVTHVSPYIYRASTYYAVERGFDVELEFSGCEADSIDVQTATFHYYEDLHAILGLTPSGELVVLLPRVPTPIFSPSGSLRPH